MKENARILVVDDERMVCIALSNWLKEENYCVKWVNDGPSALECMKQEVWDIVLLDYKMPDMDGLEVLRRIKEVAPQSVVLMMTAYASIANSVQAMKEGAYDYIVKPIDVEELSVALRKIVERQELITENLLLRKQLSERHNYENIIGKSSAMQKVFDLIRTVAGTSATVLITGETGTGKEMVARAVHATGSRRYCPFIAVSCGALPETLLESELFGYEKGAFTGADRSKKGRFELANGGTLFLDEIGDISLKTQTKLLRVLQERSFSRLGGTELIDVDVRLVTATNQNLVHLMETNQFRSDLYYRLNVVNIQLPPLRERRDDIALLAANFMEKFNLEFGKKFNRIDRKAMDLMLSYHWPGNVRELENVIERAVVIDNGPELKARHLPFFECAPPFPADEPRTLDEAEKAHLHKMLEFSQWNISKAAQVLDIDRTTLHKKILKYGLSRVT